MKLDVLQSVNSPYLLLAGVRGPDLERDDNAHTLKSTITARLRGIVFDDIEVAGMYETKPLTEQDLLEKIIPALRVIQFHTSLYHFISHLRAAVMQVRDHAVWGGFGYDLFTLLDNTYTGRLNGVADQFTKRRELEHAKQALVNEYSA